MIISLVNGGLGNQMFQYALGRKLALKHNTAFKLDTFWFLPEMTGTALRKYELHCFNIPTQPATKQEIEKLKEPFSGALAKRIFHAINARLPYYRRRIVLERQFHFAPEILKAGKNAYLEGYWQSEQYFADIRDTLLKDFSFKEPLEGENLRLAGIIGKSDSVSLHVRRVDYVQDKEVNRILGLCSPEYYESAIQHVRKNIANPVFFIFSDDIEWCKTHFMLKEETHFIGHNTGNDSYRDMQLMSLCRHNIIANSSFSWWGAWLNNNAGKIVIAPGRWFNDTSKNDMDLIPATWLRM
jgi:hypothetical protein